MGRGRAKAKQTKVARELKYHSPNTDLAALQRELAGGGKSTEKLDDYDDYLDEDDSDEDEPDQDDEGHWEPRRR